jgi:hypothetical protein
MGLLALSQPAAAASPRHELLRLVPEDVGFCLLIEDLRGHGKALLDSPFFKQFLDSPVAAKVRNAEETQKLSFLDKFLQHQFEITAEQLRDEILGDALVLAYRPGPPSQPTREQGLLLIRARNPTLLANLVERVNKLQRDSGDLKEVNERRHADRPYFQRVETKGTNFYYLKGPILAFASQEGILHQLIDLDATAPTDGEPPLGRQFRLSGVEKPLASLWINPRVFEPELQQKADSTQGAQAVALKSLLGYWHALEGIAVSILLEKDFELTLSVRTRFEALPPAARRFLHTAAQPSELWGRFPENAMLAVAGRFDVAAFVEVLGEFVTEEARRPLRGLIEGSIGTVLGKDIIGDLLPNLGPDAGLCVLAPPPDEKAWFPQVAAACRVRPGDRTTPADLTLLAALNSVATMAVFNQNGGKPGPFRLRTVLQDQVEVKYLVNEEKFPPGFQPAFALKEGYLVLASSPAAIRRLRPATQAPNKEPTAAEFPLLRLSVPEVSRYLKDRRAPLLDHVAEKNRISSEEAGQRLDGLLAALQLFDRVELGERADTDRVILTLRVRTTVPLK